MGPLKSINQLVSFIYKAPFQKDLSQLTQQFPHSRTLTEEVSVTSSRCTATLFRSCDPSCGPTRGDMPSHPASSAPRSLMIFHSDHNYSCLQGKGPGAECPVAPLPTAAAECANVLEHTRRPLPLPPIRSRLFWRRQRLRTRLA